MTSCVVLASFVKFDLHFSVPGPPTKHTFFPFLKDYTKNGGTCSNQINLKIKRFFMYIKRECGAECVVLVTQPNDHCDCAVNVIFRY